MDLPRGPRSLVDFLHEVGHIVHPRGGRRRELRAVEEYYATKYAFNELRKHAIPIAPKTREGYMRYICDVFIRALRRGLKTIPPELHALGLLLTRYLELGKAINTNQIAFKDAEGELHTLFLRSHALLDELLSSAEATA